MSRQLLPRLHRRRRHAAAVENSKGVWIDWNSWDGEGNYVDFYELDTVTLDRFYRVRVVADITDANGNWVETVSAISGTEPFPDDP